MSVSIGQVIAPWVGDVDLPQLENINMNDRRCIEKVVLEDLIGNYIKGGRDSERYMPGLIAISNMSEDEFEMFLSGYYVAFDFPNYALLREVILDSYAQVGLKV